MNDFQLVSDLPAPQRAPDAGGAELLARYVRRGDRTALGALVERYGGTVWGVCRRMLATDADAEDAFQATFLVLARKGGTIRNRGAVGSWLYGVAYRTAMKARRDGARRKAREQHAAPPPPAEAPAGVAACRELQRLLDDEVNRLPEKYRVPFVLCCIEGLGKAEAARALGWKEGTVSGRLAEARKLLQKRLTRRGVTLSAALTALALVQNTAAAAVPPLLLKSTVASFTLATPTAGLAPSAVALADGVVRTLVAAKVKLAATAVLALALAVGGAAVATNQAADAPQAPEKAEPAPRRVRTFVGPPRPFLEIIDEQVLALAFAPDGRRLVTAGGRHVNPGQIKLWDVATHQETAKVRRIRGTRCVAFAPDGKTLACGEFGGAVALRDAVTGQQLGTLQGHTVGVNGLAYSPDGRWLVTAGLDGVVKLWDVPARAERKTYRGHVGSVFSAAFFRDNQTFVTGGADKTARVWRADRDEPVYVLAGHQGIVETVAVTPDDKTVATASWDKTIKLWDAATGAESATLSGHKDGVFAVAFAPDGALLASGGADGEVCLWDAKAGQPAATLGRHAAAAWAVAFSPDGRLLASGSSDTTAKLWDVAGRKEVAALATSETWPVRALAYAPDGNEVALAIGSTVTLCDAVTGSAKMTLPGLGGAQVDCLAYAPVGDTLAVGGRGPTVRLWRRGRAPAPELKTGRVHALAFAPDGQKLATAGEDKTVKLWDATTGALLQTYEGHTAPARALAFAPTGRALASGGADKVIRVWDLEKAAEPVKLEGHDGTVRALLFAGTSLVSAGEDGTVRVWEPGRAAPPRLLKGPAPEVWSLAHLEGDAGFVSGGFDGVVLQWDLATGASRGPLRGGPRPVTSLALHPQGKELLSGGLDGRVWRWRSDTEPAVAQILQPAAAPAPPVNQEPIRNFYQDFRGGKPPESPLTLFGPKAAGVTRPEEGGLRITVTANPEQTQRIGVTLQRPVRGDFEITAGYELVGAEVPKAGHGVGAALLADLATPPGEVLEVQRTMRQQEGSTYGCVRKTVVNGKEAYQHRWVPTATKAGHLRMTRKGAELTCSAREGGSDTFKELWRTACGTGDVKEIRFVAYMGFAPNSVDLILKDLRVSSPGGPAVAAADPGEPVAEAPALPARGRFLLILLGLLSVVALLAGLGALLFFLRRRAPAEDRPAEAPAVAFACADCGKKLRVRADLAGKQVKCPQCGTRVPVPPVAAGDVS